jgi:hypothetical protein
VTFARWKYAVKARASVVAVETSKVGRSRLSSLAAVRTLSTRSSRSLPWILANVSPSIEVTIRMSRRSGASEECGRWADTSSNLGDSAERPHPLTLLRVWPPTGRVWVEAEAQDLPELHREADGAAGARRGPRITDHDRED